jgi:hypothetical protein
MGLADFVAWVMLALLIGWIAIVLWATVVQIDDEARVKRGGPATAEARRPRGVRRDSGPARGAGRRPRRRG